MDVPVFHVCARDQNSGPDAYITGILPTKLTAQAKNVVLYYEGTVQL